jgi:small subunit ribosomal protein S10
MKIKSTIKLKSFNVHKLEQIVVELKKYAETKSLTQSSVNLPTKKKRITVLKGPHVHKKARDQFELQNFTKVLIVEGTNDKIKEFLQTLENKMLDDLTYMIDFKRIK